MTTTKLALTMTALPLTRKLTRKEVQAARVRYARRHGWYVRSVQPMTTLFAAALAEWRANPGVAK